MSVPLNWITQNFRQWRKQFSVVLYVHQEDKFHPKWRSQSNKEHSRKLSLANRKADIAYARLPARAPSLLHSHSTNRDKEVLLISRTAALTIRSSWCRSISVPGAKQEERVSCPTLCVFTVTRLYFVLEQKTETVDWHLEHGGYYRHHLLSHEELRNLPTESMTNRLIAINSLHGIDWLAFIVQVSCVT